MVIIHLQEIVILAGKRKKKLITKNAVRAAVFLCLIVLIVLGCNYIFCFADAEHTETIMNEFYGQEENSVDVIYFGSSATQRAFVQPVAFHDEGVAGYSIASGSQPFMLTKYMMEEVLKTQDPDLFIIEVRGACKPPEELWDVAVRRLLDNMPLSDNKLKAIRAVTEYAEGTETGIDETGLSYAFTLLKYHGRWNPLKQPKYWDNIDYYKGYTMDSGVCFRCTEIHPINYTEANVMPIHERTEAALRDLLDYCDSIDTKVLFVVSPYEASEKGMGKINYSKQIIEERGYEVLNFLPQEKREMLGLNDKDSYYNREHLNFNGSLMYTDYLSKYIKENYGVHDRRGDSRYDSWEEQYERLQHNLETIYNVNYSDMMETVKQVRGE